MAPLRDKGLVGAAGRAELHWFGAFPPVGPLSKPEAQPQSVIKKKRSVVYCG